MKGRAPVSGRRDVRTSDARGRALPGTCPPHPLQAGPHTPARPPLNVLASGGVLQTMQRTGRVWGAGTRGRPCCFTANSDPVNNVLSGQVTAACGSRDQHALRAVRQELSGPDTLAPAGSRHPSVCRWRQSQGPLNPRTPRLGSRQPFQQPLKRCTRSPPRRLPPSPLPSARFQTGKIAAPTPVRVRSGDSDEGREDRMRQGPRRCACTWELLWGLHLSPEARLPQHSPPLPRPHLGSVPCCPRPLESH